jgi:hypothetical protein
MHVFDKLSLLSQIFINKSWYYTHAWTQLNIIIIDNICKYNMIHAYIWLKIILFDNSIWNYTIIYVCIWKILTIFENIT